MTSQINKKSLTLQQEEFCRLYATHRDLFGNGTQCYIKAYNLDTTLKSAYALAKSGACENLTKPHLLERIRELLELNGFNNERIDMELHFLIEQNADFTAKLGAIKEYNRIRQRTTEKKKPEDQVIQVNLVNYADAIASNEKPKITL